MLRYFGIMATKKLKGLDFEVYGRVQGVFFRKHTQEQAQKLGLKGWCRNTSQGTVKGVLEGPEDGVNQMKNWLQFKGSPQSQIDKAIFENEREISEFSFKDFQIKR
ncbi:acylphosphatase-2-like [Agrilus planipennis]|uniref:Acylphosphatase n=1 Tax=Agrilus planipennis TaxID=224129 RepID=A0A1W4WXE8_AGRPL|nr:acylphosphatase-2-like [Agrilus planipennis]